MIRTQGESPAKLQEKEMLKIIDLMKIKSSGNVRYEDDDELNDLVESIKKYGLLEPLVVREGKGGVYDLISGHRRYQALIRAGEIQAECNVLEIVDDDKMKIQIVENIHRKDMSCIEIVDALEKAFPGKTDVYIAKAIGKPYTWIAKQRHAAKIVNSMYLEGTVTQEEKKKLRAGQVLGRHMKAMRGEEKEYRCDGFTAKHVGHRFTLSFTNGEKEAEFLAMLKQESKKRK